jgi:hypothetical protein
LLAVLSALPSANSNWCRSCSGSSSRASCARIASTSASSKRKVFRLASDQQASPKPGSSSSARRYAAIARSWCPAVLSAWPKLSHIFGCEGSSASSAVYSAIACS